MEIGTATIEYDTTGQSVMVKFIPAEISFSKQDIANGLSQVKSCEDCETIRTNAETVMVKWFNNTSAIELADREKYGIVSEIIGECEKHPNGMIKQCSFKFTLKPL